VFGGFLLFFIFCLTRLFFIQFFRSSYLKEIAQRQHNLFIELEPRRGTIYDTNLKPQAINVARDSLYACPLEISKKDKEKIISQLASILNVSRQYLEERLSRKKNFVWLARKISPQQRKKIEDLGIEGLGFIKESKRCYPNDYLLSHVLGFAGLDNVGLEGIELYYDEYLRGEKGFAFFLRDARQKKLDLIEKMIPARDGNDLVLTIDEVIQYIVEQQLNKLIKTSHAKAASIIVINPSTGAILAMANWPTYNLNEPDNTSEDKRRNRAICDLFEPGSVFKIVTAAAALEEKKVMEKERFFCENGAYQVATHILHDHQPHGWLSFQEVIEQSSNIGTTKVAQRLGQDILYHYIKLFGFGNKLGIDLPGEIGGMIKEPRFWSKISISAIPIGQEVGVTALQLVSAISVIANGGKLMRPYLVRQIQDKYGQKIKEFSPTVIREVISLDTTNRLKKILMGAVERGTGKLAKVEGINVAGKTGTAQKLEPNGTYSHHKFVASFAGFAPVEDPLIAVVVVVDEPHPYYFGGVVAAPVFKNIVKEVIPYLRNTKPKTEEFLVLNEAEEANQISR